MNASDVPMWSIGHRNIGCIVMSVSGSGWIRTACHCIGPAGKLQSEAPNRKCSKCMKALRNGELKPVGHMEDER